jgi:hypothetical protein
MIKNLDFIPIDQKTEMHEMAVIIFNKIPLSLQAENKNCFQAP